MKKKTKPGAIQQLLSYAVNNKKQLYLSTFLATLGELFGMAPFITVSRSRVPRPAGRFRPPRACGRWLPDGGKDTWGPQCIWN